ncbi:MAG: WD40 repeat domain-containing protein [Anaerolineae bacterium]|nr:WD40 repeat domain-containing protein [Anaerolineae bacterium]
MAQEVPGYPAPAILDLEWSPNGAHLARVFADGRVQILDARLEQIVRSFPPPPIPTLLNAQIDWSSDGTQLAWGVGNTVTLWNLEDEQVERTFLTGEPNGIIISEFGLFPEGVVSLEWSSDDAMLMVLSESARLSVFSLPSGINLFDGLVGNQPISSVWLPDDSGIRNGQRIFDIQTLDFRF